MISKPRFPDDPPVSRWLQKIHYASSSIASWQKDWEARSPWGYLRYLQRQVSELVYAEIRVNFAPARGVQMVLSEKLRP